MDVQVSVENRPASVVSSWSPCHLWAAWFGALWLSIALLPPLRLPARIPVRVDDVLVAAGFSWMVLESLTRGRLPRVSAIGVVLLSTAAFILGVTAVGPPLAELTVGPKEFADTFRPLKFLAVLLLVRRMGYQSVQKMLVRLVPFVTFVLVTFGLAQFLLLRPDSNNMLARFSMLFSELEEWHIRLFFGYRPFATFHTPTDLGYYMSVTLVLALFLTEMKLQRAVVLVSLVGIMLSATRTFLFSMPLLLVVYAVVSHRRVLAKGKALMKSLALIAIGAILLLAILPLIYEDFALDAVRTFSSLVSGEFAEDQSITQRLENLELIRVVLAAAPLTGIVSRDLFTVGVDSEYIMTLHRYGIIGLFFTVMLYIVALASIWSKRHDDRRLALLVLFVVVLTFIYGITQGALINPRIGCIVFILMGAFQAKVARKRREFVSTRASKE